MKAQTQPVRLKVLQPGAVRGRADIFECSALVAKLSARACVARQQAAHLKVLAHPTCQNCATGQQIAKRLGLDVDGKDLVPGVALDEERRHRAGRHAHTTGQGYHRAPDDEEAA